MRQFNPPYFGADYYPEDWPEEQTDEDIRLMKEAGVNTVRIAEFAWYAMEPEDGVFNFGWLHRVIRKLELSGIAVILCTPTCTPPSWLSCKYPEILVMDSAGTRAQHGARRNACPTNGVYRKYTGRIVKKMAEEFGNCKNVIGWQIDNEIYPNGRGCCCPDCTAKFRKSMREKYGCIENLNEAWCLNLWSQCYSSFEEIPVPPREETWHHPSLLKAWMSFQSDSYADFVDFQAEILHRYVKVPVGTDMMPFGGFNYARVHRHLDVVMFNHYNTENDLWRAAFWMDFLRTVKSRPFWNTETQTCWNGSTCIGMDYQQPGFCRINSWLPFALGGEANLYWLWRAHISGQELLHGSVIDSWGRPLHIFGEVQEIAGGLEKCRDFLCSTAPEKSGVALHLSGGAWWDFLFQPMVNGLSYLNALQDVFYRPLNEGQYRPDVIDPDAPLDGYRLVMTPLLPYLGESGLDKKLKSWIEAGGVWIAGPLTDTRNGELSKYRHAPFGVLESWGGTRCKYQVPYSGSFGAAFEDGTEFSGSLWHDVYEPSEAKPLVKYAGGEFDGFSAVTVREMGKGKIILLGTLPSRESFMKLFCMAAQWARVKPVADAPENVLYVPRRGNGEGAVVLECRNTASRFRAPYGCTDLLTGAEYRAGEIEIAPHGVMVLKRI